MNPQSNEQGPANTFDSILPLGSLLLGRYEVFGVRKGGMSQIYFVEDQVSGEKHAVKTFSNVDRQRFAETKREFLHEINVWLKIPDHPHIVRLLFVEIIDERPWLFMEYVPGFSLRDKIGHINEVEALTYAYQISLAMEFVNETSKIVHADLKPENILIAKNETIKVTDFGVSKLNDPLKGTFARQTVGTPLYMPPEQLRGEVVDEDSDIFAFGIMFFEMLEGKLPYPFAIPNDVAEQRKALKAFYDNMGSAFWTDDDRFGPWASAFDNMNLGKHFRSIISACILPKRKDRWRGFWQIRQTLESQIEKPLLSKTGAESDANYLSRKAWATYKAGRIAASLDLFNEALRLSPGQAEIWRDAAIVLTDSGRQDIAKAFVERSRQLDSNIDLTHPLLMSIV